MNTITLSDKPQDSQKFIAYLDILGFKELINNNKHSKLYELYKYISTVLDYLLRDTNNINSCIISDSIIIWTKDDSYEESFNTITLRVNLIMYYLFTQGLPVRGALVFGHLDEIKSNILIGKGLVTAYEIEQKQEWSGCVVDWCGDNLWIEGLIKRDVLIRYNVPYKEDNKKNEKLVINWVKCPTQLQNALKEKQLLRYNKNFTFQENEIRSCFEMHNKTIENDEGKKIKMEKIITNTLSFINFVNNR